MNKKPPALIKPMTYVCEDLLQRFLDQDNITDISIRFTWDGELMRTTVTTHDIPKS